jgi:hypothetical protein
VLSSPPFRHQAIYFQTLSVLQQTTDPQNSLAVVALQELSALVCILIATHGLSVQRRADIRNVSHRKHWVTAVALSTKRMQEV